MHWIVLPIMLQASDVTPLEAPTSNPAPTEVSTPSQEVEDCKEGVKGLRDDFKGLELYLQDKKDHKEHCPGTKWEQPSIDEYKKQPKSHLPDKCIVKPS
jgi:hypothetical protein